MICWSMMGSSVNTTSANECKNNNFTNVPKDAVC